VQSKSKAGAITRSPSGTDCSPVLHVSVRVVVVPQLSTARSYDLSYDYLNSVVRSTYDIDLQGAKIFL